MDPVGFIRETGKTVIWIAREKFLWDNKIKANFRSIDVEPKNKSHVFLLHCAKFIFMRFRLFMLSLLAGSMVYSQQTANNTNSEKLDETAPLNAFELKLNAFELLVSPAIGIHTEKYLNQFSSVGAYLYFNFNRDDSSFRYETFEISPFYRQYFGNRKKNTGAGFFTEIFASFLNVQEYDYRYYDYYVYPGYDIERSTQGTAAMGITIGHKWINPGNFTFEIHAGAGRYLSDTYYDAYPRIGFLLGKRF